MSRQYNEEISTFMDAMQDVKPLPKQDKVVSLKAKPTLAQSLKREALQRDLNLAQNYLSTEHVEPLDPYDHLIYKKPGVQEGVFKNLRLGKYKIDSVLNLQQYKFEQARQTLFETIIQSQQKGIRTLLIKHGIGLNSQPFPAFLKSYVYKWLQQMPQVLAFHTAQKYHGGSASVYVLLKKSETDKATNRELHRKK
ncbi:MAG: DNA endonuclease SmrA [Aliiglaciecola sp.]|uniref:DNA endonuclease SmrA n=1 Tax=Aliiglaciecola sp. TaxID=1872441 RepID=UPI003299EF82